MQRFQNDTNNIKDMIANFKEEMKNLEGGASMTHSRTQDKEGLPYKSAFHLRKANNVHADIRGANLLRETRLLQFTIFKSDILRSSRYHLESFLMLILVLSTRKL